MTLTRETVEEMYTKRVDQYTSFINAFRSPKGLEMLLPRTNLLREGLCVLDAGCGYGMASLALIRALKVRNLDYERIDGFDLTAAMLERFQHTIETRVIPRVQLRQADVLALETLPEAWKNYDLVIAASMLEYLPRKDLVRALAGLRGRMLPDARLLVLITRKTPETKVLIDWWWRAERYTLCELQQAFDRAGLHSLKLHPFPLRYWWLNRATFAIEAAS